MLTTDIVDGEEVGPKFWVHERWKGDCLLHVSFDLQCPLLEGYEIVRYCGNRS